MRRKPVKATAAMPTTMYTCPSEERHFEPQAKASGDGQRFQIMSSLLSNGNDKWLKLTATLSSGGSVLGMSVVG